jgi:hypothetical protein
MLTKGKNFVGGEITEERFETVKGLDWDRRLPPMGICR